MDTLYYINFAFNYVSNKIIALQSFYCQLSTFTVSNPAYFFWLLFDTAQKSHSRIFWNSCTNVQIFSVGKRVDMQKDVEILHNKRHS